MAPLTGYYYRIKKSVVLSLLLPELNLVEDGFDPVLRPDSPSPATHHTIFAIAPISFDAFSSWFEALPFETPAAGRKR